MSETSHLTPKQRIINNAANAVAGKDVCDPSAPCQPCKRADLQLLVVIPSVLPKAHAPTLQSAGYAWAPNFDAEFGALKREATVPVARVMRQGYLYLYYLHRQRWDVWQVMSNGLTRRIMSQVNKDQYEKRQLLFGAASAPKLCGQGAANLPAHLISINGASTCDKVWVAFSHRLWSPTVLERFANNPTVDVLDAQGKAVGTKKLRELRGSEISPKDILGGKFPTTGCLPLNAATLQGSVADFGKSPIAELNKAFESSLHPLDPVRLGTAAAFEESVRRIEKISSPAADAQRFLNKSLVLMVADDLGVAEQHNHLRLLAVEAKKAWAIGAPDEKGHNADPKRAWLLRSSAHIEVIEGWAKAQGRDEVRQYLTRAMNKNLAPVTEEDYKRDMASGRYPPGTTWAPVHLRRGSYSFPFTIDSEPVLGADGKPVIQTVASRYHPGQQTALGRLGYPSEQIKQVADKRHERVTTEARLARYREKLRMDELNAFRQDFAAASERWDAHIACFDRDFARWRNTGFRLGSLLTHEFVTTLNLTQPDAAHGSPAEQVDEVIARWAALEMVWGGGAISTDSAQEVIAQIKKDPSDPSNWIDNALLAPFAYTQAIMADKGKQKDSAEKLNAMVELPALVKEALQARHEKLHAAVESLLAARQQALNLTVAALDPQKAKAMGVAQTSTTQVMQHYKLHVRTTALLNEILNPSETYATVRVKLPLGEALDELNRTFNQSQLDLSIESKNTTTRQERRKSSQALRKLAGRHGLERPEYYPVILKRSTLDKLLKQAARVGDELVEVIPDGTLGGLKEPFKLPKSLALKIVSDQGSVGKAAMNAVWSRQGRVIGLVGIFQIFALVDALGKLDDVHGYDYVDTLMTVFTSSTGVLEGGLSITSSYYSIRTAGSKVMLTSTFTRAAYVRLAGGLFGAAGSGFDAVASFAKYASRKERRDVDAALEYRRSGVMFLGSSLAITGGFTVLFANQMARRGATSAIGALSEGLVVRLGGAAAAELLGASLMGVGVVLAIAGFGWALYAQSLEDDLNEVFLKRSYWGSGERHEGRFGGTPRTRTDRAESQLAWVGEGLASEASAFAALSAGLKASLEWHSNWFKTKMVQARLECAFTTDQRRVSYSLLIHDAQHQALATLTAKDAPFQFDEDSGHYVIDLQQRLEGAQWDQAVSARFTYQVDERQGLLSIGRDSLTVTKS